MATACQSILIVLLGQQDTSPWLTGQTLSSVGRGCWDTLEEDGVCPSVSRMLCACLASAVDCSPHMLGPQMIGAYPQSHSGAPPIGGLTTTPVAFIIP